MEEALKIKRARAGKTKFKSRTKSPALWVHPHTTFKVGYGLASLLLFHFVLFQFALGFYAGPTAFAAVPAAVQKQAVAPIKPVKGLPVRIKIPKLRVNALVRYVGRLPDGSMGVPKLPRDAAWYMLGPKPGEKGSAVIAGHLNWWSGATGVFEHLKTLKPGDRITVLDDQGKNVTFVVRTTREYGQKDDASDVFFSDDGKAHLNLVTCAGIWDTLTKTYSKRLVVFTDKVE